MKVFVDTGVFIALFVKQEISHLEVVEKYHDYKTQKANFYTSDYVLDELFTWFVSHQSASNTKKIVAAVADLENAKEIRVLEIDSHLRRQSTGIFVKYLDHGLSFTDSTIITIYKEFKMDEIFTLDKGFSKLRLHTTF